VKSSITQIKTFGTSLKDRSYESSLKEREEVDTKGINNVSNKIIAKNFPNIEKERAIQVEEIFTTSNR
jgi:hypothetical protein